MENRGRKEESQERRVRGCYTISAKRPVELGKRETVKERGELPNEEGNVVREYKAMHEEDFWNSWMREDEKSKEERKVEAEEKGEVEGEKRKREEEKEENETVTVKRRCEGLVSVEAFDIFGQEGGVESCGDVSWEDVLDNPEDLSDYEPDSCAHDRVVPDVWLLCCVVFLPVARIGNLCNRSPFLSPCTLWYRYAERDEVRRLTSKCTPL